MHPTLHKETVLIRNTTLVLFIIFLPLILPVSVPGICETLEIDETYVVDMGKTFIVDIDIDAAEITVKRNNVSDECHVDIEYNPFKFNPGIEYISRKNRLEVEIDCENLFGKNDCGDHCEENGDDDCCCKTGSKIEVVIELPYSPETEIDADIKAGDIEFILGDLAISSFRLRCLAGATDITFDMPNRTVCNNFDVHTSIGETNLNLLGNGRIQYADINSGIGELNIDFNGVEADGVEARIDLDIGETKITVPDDIGVKARVSRFVLFSNMDCSEGFSKRGKTYYSDNYDTTGEQLILDITAGLGELKLKREDVYFSRN